MLQEFYCKRKKNSDYLEKRFSSNLEKNLKNIKKDKDIKNDSYQYIAQFKENINIDKQGRTRPLDKPENR